MSAAARVPERFAERSAGTAAWVAGLEAAALLAIDPVGLGGAMLRGGPGLARDCWLAALTARLAAGVPVRRMPAMIDDDRLLGGLDLAATLTAGRPVIQSGLLAATDGGVLVMPSAERISAGLAARIAGAMDRGEVILERDGAARRLPSRFAIVALDESVGDSEAVPLALEDRVAFLIDLTNADPRGAVTAPVRSLAPVRARLAKMKPLDAKAVEALVHTAEAFGVPSLHSVYLAMRAASVIAAQAGRMTVKDEDIAAAARLVLAPRATRLPAEQEPEADEPEAEDETPPDEAGDDDRVSALEDTVLEAVRAAIPDGLLDALQAGKPLRGAQKSAPGGGQMRKSPLRGRPLGSRAGSLKPGTRLSLVDTLRAAAPWQSLRQRETKRAMRVEVRPSDFRIRRFAERREATIIFAVDASGSAAFHRLAEAKGAVELLLAEVYAARTNAALVAFRGAGAELLLPPTRALARARARLAELPGGGGTPLAAGLDAALALALSERSRGRDAMIVLLTDGSANIARDGTGSRVRASAEAQEAATRIGVEGIATVFIDNAPRPRPESRGLAAAMNARYLALPYLDATGVRNAVRASSPQASRGAR